MNLISEHRCFDGWQRFYVHESRECQTPMRFSVYTPPQAANGPVATLYFLSGLTCTEETFMVKAGAQRWASELGLMLVAPDTSPRAARMPGDDESWDFGLAAGFYVDATQAPWTAHYRMYSYVTCELPELAVALGADADRQGICGHSMGGHGALVCALRNPERYRSVSAFAPIVAPSQVPWGQKAFRSYLGEDRSAWLAYDATALMQTRGYTRTILIDQGDGDKFLREQLQPELFANACRQHGVDLTLRMHTGYDHGYYFIATFIEEHLRFHAQLLQ